MNPFDFIDPTIEGGTAFEASQFLWPDPFEAPWVPPTDMLLRLVRHPEEDPSLAGQVLQSMEGRRAVALLDSLRALGRVKERETPLVPINKTLTAEHGVAKSPAFGEIWLSSQFAEHFDENGILARRSWRPALALIVSEPQDLGYDSVCRGIYCGSTELCEREILSSTPCFRFIDEDENEFVAHLDLEYPISCFQLDRRIAGIAFEEVTVLQEALASFLKDEPHPRLSSWRTLSKAGEISFQKISAMAQWLCQTVDARLRKRESEAEEVASNVLRLENWDGTVQHHLSQIEEALPLAASGGRSRTTVLFTTGSLNELSRPLVTGDMTPMEAVLHEYPKGARDGSATGQWELPEPLTDSDDTEFFLIRRTDGTVLGAGTLIDHQFLELKHGDAEALEQTPTDGFVLIISSNPSA